MDLETRLSKVIKALNKAETSLSARDLCKMYLTNVTSSDILSTQVLLKVLRFLGYVTVRDISTHRRPRYVYKAVGQIKVEYQHGIMCPVVEQYKNRGV